MQSYQIKPSFKNKANTGDVGHTRIPTAASAMTERTHFFVE